MEKTRPKRNIAFKSISFVLLPFILLSCDGGNKRKNSFLAGSFEGIPESEPNITCHFTVKEISQVAYLNAKGLNVVQDMWDFRYYLLSFWTIDENEVRKNYDFINLKDSLPTVKALPISYEDDNGSRIHPCGTWDGRPLHTSMIGLSCYSISVFEAPGKLAEFACTVALCMKGEYV